MTAAEDPEQSKEALEANANVADVSVRMLHALASHYGVSAEQLMSELSGNTALAKIGRDILGFPDNPPEAKRRGRPPRTDENWQLFVAVVLSLRRGSTIADAVREFIDSTDGENPAENRYSTLYGQYRRLAERWRASEVPDGLAALFTSPPSD